MPTKDKTDYYSKTGAADLVAAIENYWTRLGFHGIVAQRYKLAGFDLYGVRSNIGPRGFPPRRVGRSFVR